MEGADNQDAELVDQWDTICIRAIFVDPNSAGAPLTKEPREDGDEEDKENKRDTRSEATSTLVSR